MACSTCGDGGKAQEPTLNRSQMMDLAAKLADVLDGDQVENREITTMIQSLANISKDKTVIFTKAMKLLDSGLLPEKITALELRQVLNMAQQVASIGR